MDPVITKILENVPYAGMGSTLERNALIGVIRNLIKDNKFTVDYILNYCESVGYKRQMAEDVFKELTGLIPALIVNNNEYYEMPAFVPNMCIAWGLSKSNKEKAFYIVPFSYGYAVMEKDEVNAPVSTIICATIPEAFTELKKVAKNIQTLDKIITEKLLEAEDVPTTADNTHQVNLPYSVSPLQVLKKSFKNKVLSGEEFERQAKQLLASDEITVDEAEDLMNWKQELIEEDDSYANETLQIDENWKPLGADNIDENEPDYENRIKEAFTQLSGMIEELDIFKDYAKRSGKGRLFDAYIQLAHEVADEWDVKPEALLGEMTLENPELVERIENQDIDNFNQEVKNWTKSQEKFPWKGGSKKKSSKKVAADDDDFNGYHSSEEYLNSYEHLYETLVTGNIDLYKEKLNKLSKAELMAYIDWAEEMGIGREELKLHYITASKKMATFDNVKYSLNDALIILRNNGLEYKDLEEVKETSSNPKEMKQALSTAIERIQKSGIDAEESLKGYTEDLNNTSDEFVSFPKTENEMKELYNRLLNDEVLQFNTMEQLFIGESKQKIDEGALYLYYRGHGQYAVDPTYENFKRLVNRIENKKSASKKQSGIVPTEKITLADGRTFTVRYNPNEKSITAILDESGKEIGVDVGTRLQLLRKLFHKGEPTIVESKKKNAGYSNNPDYFGDWFGKGQIDYSKIINPEDEGKIWMLKIWGGKGYILDVYLVKANDYEDAIDKVFEWSYENEGNNKIIFDYDYLSERCHEDYEDEWFYGKDEGKPSDKMSYEDFETEWMSDWVSNSNYNLFARSENFFIDELPEEYVNKKQSSKKVISESVSEKDLEAKAKHYEDLLKEEGYKDMKVTPYFAYGSYGFYFDWTRDDGKPGQKYTGLGTKKETWKNLELVYYELVNRIDWFMKRKSSKKVTAENITLEDIEAEDNKDQVQEEIEKIDETPAEDIFSETTPEQYFDDALKEDKVDTINEVVSKCIDKFAEKFKDFDKYEVKILSYNTKVLGDYVSNTEEMVEDEEINANAILQVILSITNNADETSVKKALAVFSITNGELHWTGTVRGENDQIVAFTEEGLDALFEVNEPSEEELEDII